MSKCTPKTNFWLRHWLKTLLYEKAAHKMLLKFNPVLNLPLSFCVDMFVTCLPHRSSPTRWRRGLRWLERSNHCHFRKIRAERLSCKNVFIKIVVMLMKHILLSYDKMTVKKTTIIKFCIYSITKLRMIYFLTSRFTWWDWSRNWSWPRTWCCWRR